MKSWATVAIMCEKYLDFNDLRVKFELFLNFFI